MDDKEHKEKHSDHTYKVVGRLASRAGSAAEGKRLIRRIYAALGSMNAFGVTFAQRNIRSLKVSSQMFNRESPFHYRSLVNATELATLLALPAGNPGVPGLPQGRSRHLPADGSIPSTGVIVASSNFPGAERPLAMSPLDLTRHVHILGATGTGKSSLMEIMAAQIMEQGLGLTFIDPHGDSYRNLRNLVPKSRIEDVTLLDLTDATRPVGFNVLSGDPYLVTNQVMAVFDKLYDIYRMPQTSDILRSTILTLAQKGLTLLDIPAILSPTQRQFRDKVTRGLADPALRDFWRQYNGLKPERQNENIAPVLRRIRPFETWPSLRGCLGQMTDGFDMEAIFREGKILLVNLSKGQLGEEEARLFGSLFVTRFWNAAQRQARVSAGERKLHFLFVDEAQNYTNLPVSFGDVLAESRKYGLGFIMAHQHMGQLPMDLKEALAANARTKLIFQTSASDASSLAREIPQLKPEDLQNLGQYEVIARLTVDNQTAAPASGVTLPPFAPTGTARAVVAASSAKYGRPIAEVEAELVERHRFDEPLDKPAIGREEDTINV